MTLWPRMTLWTVHINRLSLRFVYLHEMQTYHVIWDLGQVQSYNLQTFETFWNLVNFLEAFILALLKMTYMNVLQGGFFFKTWAFMLSDRWTCIQQFCCFFKRQSRSNSSFFKEVSYNKKDQLKNMAIAVTLQNADR